MFCIIPEEVKYLINESIDILSYSLVVSCNVFMSIPWS